MNSYPNSCSCSNFHCKTLFVWYFSVSSNLASRSGCGRNRYTGYTFQYSNRCLCPRLCLKSQGYSSAHGFQFSGESWNWAEYNIHRIRINELFYNGFAAMYHNPFEFQIELSNSRGAHVKHLLYTYCLLACVLTKYYYTCLYAITVL